MKPLEAQLRLMVESMLSGRHFRTGAPLTRASLATFTPQEVLHVAHAILQARPDEYLVAFGGSQCVKGTMRQILMKLVVHGVPHRPEFKPLNLVETSQTLGLHRSLTQGNPRYFQLNPPDWLLALATKYKDGPAVEAFCRAVRDQPTPK